MFYWVILKQLNYYIVNLNHIKVDAFLGISAQ